MLKRNSSSLQSMDNYRTQCLLYPIGLGGVPLLSPYLVGFGRGPLLSPYSVRRVSLLSPYLVRFGRGPLLSPYSVRRVSLLGKEEFTVGEDPVSFSQMGHKNEIFEASILSHSQKTIIGRTHANCGVSYLDPVRRHLSKPGKMFYQFLDFRLQNSPGQSEMFWSKFINMLKYLLQQKRFFCPLFFFQV